MRVLAVVLRSTGILLGATLAASMHQFAFLIQASALPAGGSRLT